MMKPGPARGGPSRVAIPPASLRSWGVFGLALLIVWTSACRSVGGSRRGEAAPADTEPPISVGASSAAADSAARALLDAARAALSAGDAATAAEAAGEVVDRYPTARRSSLALPLLAEARLTLEAWEPAATAARGYAALFDSDDPRAARAALLEARALRGGGDPAGAVRRLLELPPGGVLDSGAMELMRSLAAQLDNETLATLVSGTAPRPLSAPLIAERALALWFQGDAEAARAWAGRILELGIDGPDVDLARSILDDRVEDLAGAQPVLGAMLAETGSPGLTEFSQGVREGVEVALALDAETSRRPARLEVLDDRGSPAAADAVVRRLEEQGALAVIGPLLGSAVEPAARARTRSTVLISPTARSLPTEQGGVYSLSGPDDGAAEALASYASARGLARIVVLRPDVHASMREADAFRRALEDLGLQLVREVAYDSGATFFQEQLSEVEGLMPDALVLPLPVGDVELLAPQITFFGLDTLGIQVMGTASWTSEAVLEEVDPRHTTGVVAATATIPGQPSEGRIRFVEAYESRFRRTLRSPVPALGHDAAALLLEAIRVTGARTPEDVRRGLEGITDFPGATGLLSVRDGRIVRRHRLVRFEDGVLVPLDATGGD